MSMFYRTAVGIFICFFLTRLALDIRTILTDTVCMNGNELLKKLKGLGKQRGIPVTIEKHHGKGSHATLYFGDNRTTMKDRKKEIGKGLLNSMLADLGIDKDEI